MTFSTKGGIHYTIFSEPRRVHYYILSKDGDLYKKYKALWSLLFQPHRRAPCWVDYQFSDTKVRITNDITKYNIQYIY